MQYVELLRARQWPTEVPRDMFRRITGLDEFPEALRHRVAIIDRGRTVATGTLDELRAEAGSEHASLEDLFLKLTAGPESKELIERLLAPNS